MFYAVLGIHLVMILIAARIWKRRGLEWSVMETAWCVVIPFAMGLGLIALGALLGALVPHNWSLETFNSWGERYPALATFLLCMALLAGFWTWFFLSEGRTRCGAEDGSQMHTN